MGIFPKELLDGLRIALSFEKDGRLLVVAREEVDGGIAADVDVLGGVVDGRIHLGDHKISRAIGLKLLPTSERQRTGYALRGIAELLAPS